MSIASFFRWLFHRGKKTPPVTAPVEEPVVEKVEEVPAPVEESVVDKVEEIPEPIEEPVVEQPVAEVTKPEAESEAEEAEPNSVVVKVKTASGGHIFIRMNYNRSFTAKLIQSGDTVKNYYSVIKNELLKYGTRSRTSWKHETFKKGRKLLARFAMRGKTLGVYLALNPADYADSKYKLLDVSNVAKNAEVPALYKIKNEKRCRYIKELIADLMAANGLVAGEECNINYAEQYPYEETQALIQKRLIKIISYEEEAAVTTAEPVEEVVISEEMLEEIEEAVAVQAEMHVAPEEVKESVSVYEAEEHISDEDVEHFVHIGRRVSDKAKKAIVNIDTLSKYFKKGEKVTVEEIAKRVPEISKKTTYIKVLGRGTLDKPLIIEADDFSPSAIKMIVLTGGEVIRTKKN